MSEIHSEGLAYPVNERLQLEFGLNVGLTDIRINGTFLAQYDRLTAPHYLSNGSSFSYRGISS